MKYYINKHNFINESKLRKINKCGLKCYWTFLNSINRNKDIKNPNLQEFHDYFEKGNKPFQNSS
jgi:hypothetical protein